MIYENILDTIGHTPVVRINRLAPKGVEMFVKLEAFNPMGSVKDRLALGIVLDAEKRGVLKPGQTVVEATSGNTGIALAMVCAVRGYPFVAVMAGKRPLAPAGAGHAAFAKYCQPCGQLRRSKNLPQGCSGRQGGGR